VAGGTAHRANRVVGLGTRRRCVLASCADNAVDACAIVLCGTLSFLKLVGIALGARATLSVVVLATCNHCILVLCATVTCLADSIFRGSAGGSLEFIQQTRGAGFASGVLVVSAVGFPELMELASGA